MCLPYPPLTLLSSARFSNIFLLFLIGQASNRDQAIPYHCQTQGCQMSTSSFFSFSDHSDIIFLAVKIKKTGASYKFKVRCSRYLYTLVVSDSEKAEKLKQSLPPGNEIYINLIFKLTCRYHFRRIFFVF